MKKDKFLDKTWLDNHLKELKDRAGNRYTPELNIDLPIAEIFYGISRTENFYTSIRKHYGKLNREFGHVSSNYENKEIQMLYKTLLNEISQLSKLLDKLKEYNTREIPWNKINKRTRGAKEITWKLSDKLREEKDKAEQQKTDEKQCDQRSASERFGSDIHYLYEVQKELRYFEELSSSTKSKLSNFPFLLLTGIAGTGKTHLLCDVLEDRITGEKSFPAVLVFGEFFATKDDPFSQIIRQLGLQLNKKQFLKLLNDAGKQSGCRAIIAIDALNETSQRNFWKRNLGKVVDEIKKYPNIALVISLRTGFEEEVITKKLRKTLVHEEHRGFEFREWEAVTKFFKEFDLPLPEIPLLLPEFREPLFLILFCAAFGKKNKDLSEKTDTQLKKIKPLRGHVGATHIFESFVKQAADQVASDFGLPKGRNEKGEYVIWDTVIEKIAEEMVEQNDDRISEDNIAAIVKMAYPSIDYDHFIKALDRNLLLVKVPRYSVEKGEYEGFDFRFPFQKFSDHLVGRYIFKKYEKEFGSANKNFKTAKKFFSRRRKLGKFLSKSWNRGIIEALSVQCPEQLKGIEFIDVAPYLKKERNLLQMTQEAFIESLIWRSPKAISQSRIEKISKFIDDKVLKVVLGQTYYPEKVSQILNALLSVAPIKDHPLNADFLHNHLFKFSMAKRDSWWSTFLHYQHGEKGAVDRLIEWGWSEQDKAHINDDAIRLCSVALCWLLTTPNRFIRDKATKALVALLTNRLNVVLSLLKQFKDVNDPYVAERLYAIAYGCAIRSRKEKEGLKALSQWIYCEIFKHGNPPAHILLRDYARGIIEVALLRKIPLRISRKKARLPYNSKWPSRFPSNETIGKYEFDYKGKSFEDYQWAQNSIIYSMQPEHSEIFMYGDFGRYTFQSALSHFSYPKDITMQKLSNWATKRAFDLGYDVILHGNFDRNLNRYHNSRRSEHKPERIGKKYQWIAFHELLALVSDHFQVKDETAWFKKKTIPYEGSWQLSIRDIDPSCILKEFPNAKPEGVPDFGKNEVQSQYNAWNKKISDSVWLKKSQDLPDPKKVIEFVDDQGNVWVSLEGFVEWQEEAPPEQEKYNLPTRTLWYMVKSYLVRNRDKDTVFEWAKRQHFIGRWMPESHEFYHVYLGEYPWATAFLYHYIPYYHHEGWTDGARDKKIPTKILVTDDQYLSSGSSIDCSTYEAISVKLPAKFIVDEMNLVQHYTDGRFFDKKGDLVAFDPSVFDNIMPRNAFIRKDKLCDFLKRKGYALFWTLLGEKNMIGGDVIGQPRGWLEIDGAYTLNGKNKIIGTKRGRFQKSR